jgi:hypothetical protein
MQVAKRRERQGASRPKPDAYLEALSRKWGKKRRCCRKEEVRLDAGKY